MTTYGIDLIAILIAVISFIQLIIFFYQYISYKTYKGFGWWVMWSAFELIGFLIYTLRTQLEPSFTLLIPQHFFVLMGIAFLQAGVLLFIGKKVKWNVYIIMFGMYVLFLSYFTFFNNISIARSVIMNLAISFMLFYNAYVLLKTRIRQISSSSIFLTIAFLVPGIVFLAISVIQITAGFNDVNNLNDELIFAQFLNQFISQILWLLGVILIMNQRLHSEVKESQEHFRTLFELNPEGATLTSINDGTIIDVNESFARQLGYKREDLIGKTTLEINIWRDPAERSKFTEAINKNGYCDNLEIVYNRIDGTTSTALLSGKKLELNGKTHLINVMRDISERKELEKLLHDEKEKYKLLAENMSDVVWTMDAETMTITYISPSIEKLTGYTSEEIMLKPAAENYSPEGSEEFRMNKIRLDEVLKTGKEINDKFYVEQAEQPCKDGRKIWTEVVSKYYHNPITGRMEIHGVTRNISERKKAEIELKQKNDELEKINAEKDKFFSIISHDLRSPFNGILGITKLMASDLKQFSMQEISDISHSLNQSANNLYRLLNNLLEWSRMHRGAMDFNPEYFHLNSIVKDLEKLFDDTAAQKEITLIDNVNENIFINADKNMMETVLRNLISNGIKFTKNGGKVTISAEKKEGKVRISVEDTGIGIPDEIIDNLFRIDKQPGRMGTNNEPGTSLGLVLCKEFIEKHGSRLELKSEVGKGSNFSFEVEA